MSSPSSRICPPATRPLPGSRPMAASAVVDLPEPDSPTMATVSPGMMVRCALRTAWTSPLPVVKEIARSRISSSGRSAGVPASWIVTSEVVMIASFIADGSSGSRASRRASPSMMKLNTVMDRAAAG